MPPKQYLLFPQYEGDLRIMPAMLGERFAGVKIVNSHGRNPERGLPTVVGTYLLVSQETGMPVALLNATSLTAVRTAAASALATRYMSRKNASTLGLVGAGVQAAFHLEAILAVADVTEVKVWAPQRDAVRRDAFIKQSEGRFPEISLQPASEIHDAADSDIVCTTTPSRIPIVFDRDIRAGTHINAVGADGPGKQELDPAILKRSRVIVDEWEQASHGGEINVPLETGEITRQHIAGSLDKVVSGEVAGRASEDEVTIFDSTGLAIEDIAAAALVYERALSSGTGTEIEL